MSKIKSKRTKLDLRMEEILIEYGLDYEMYPDIYGHPDFLVRSNVLVFCDSSFWHGRNWTMLKKKLKKGNNPDYWIDHIQKNRKRDELVTKRLTRDGYVVLRLWDDEVFKQSDLCVRKIIRLLD